MIAAVHDAELVAGLLLQQKGLRVNKRNADRKFALRHSVAVHSSTVANRLLQDPRVKIDRPNHEGQTALWLVVFQENRCLVDLLLTKGANLDATDWIGMSPWIRACIRNRNSIKDLMLEHLKATSPDVFSLGMGPAREEETVFFFSCNERKHCRTAKFAPQRRTSFCSRSLRTNTSTLGGKKCPCCHGRFFDYAGTILF